MANFNEKVNNNSELFYVIESLLINRAATINEFKRAIGGWMDEYFDPSSSLYKSKARLATMSSCFRYKKVGDMNEIIQCSSPRKLFILYKKRHRSKELAGGCFVWDVMDEAYCGLRGQELQKESYGVSTVRNGFGIPRFDGVDGAALITDREVVVYGRAMIVATEMDLEKGRFDVCFGDMRVYHFDTDTAEFDRSFVIKANFPEQFDDRFVSAKSDDKCVDLEAETRNRLEAVVQEMKKEDLWIEPRTWEWHTGETKTQRIQVRFTVEELKRVEEMAARLGTSRVEFIRSAIDYVVRNLEVQA